MFLQIDFQSPRIKAKNYTREVGPMRKPLYLLLVCPVLLFRIVSAFLYGQGLPNRGVVAEGSGTSPDSLEGGTHYGFKVQLLTDPTRYKILSALVEYRNKLHADDSLLVYYAGHGLYDKETLKGYWLPADAEKDVDANWIIADDITSRIRVLPARHILVVSDSCFSGMLTRSIASNAKYLDPGRYLQ